MTDPLTTNDRASRLRDLRVRLKSGEYDGADIMAAWIACDDLADMLDRAAHEPEDAHAANFTEWLCNEMPAGTVIGDPAWWARKIWAAAIVFAPEEPTAPPPEAAPKPSYDLQATLYALLCNRGYAQHEAHSLAYDDVLPLVAAPPPPDVQAWQPIETVPHMVEVVCWWTEINGALVDTVEDTESARLYGYSHWMPLPSPPPTKKGAL